VNTVSISVYFFIAVFLVISLVTSRSSDVTLASAVVKAMSIGMLGGLAMGLYFAYSFKAHALTKWDEL